MRRLSLLALPVSILTMIACSSSSEPAGTPSTDAAVDTTPDPGDAAADAPSEASPGGDTSPDASPDASPDTTPDAPTTKPEGWDTDYALPGMAGDPTASVSAMVVTAKRWIYAGGQFHHAGSVAAKNIAVWNGLKWNALGAGLPGNVVALAATPTDEVYASVEQDGGTHLWHWDKTKWTDLAVAADDWIQSIDVGADGTLWVAGFFTKIGGKDAKSVATYKAGTWSAVGTLAANGLEVVRATNDGACVGGNAEFDGIGVSCWNGTTWTSRKSNLMRGTVKALRVGAAGALYAAGEFGTSEDMGVPGSLAKWNATTSKWELIGGGVANIFGSPGNVTDLAVNGDKVYVTGRFVGAGAINVKHVAMWDGKKWFDLDGGLGKHFGITFGDTPLGFALAVDDGGELYVGGNFTRAGGKNAMYLARFDGATWNPVDEPTAIRRGINGNAATVVATADGKSTYVGGGFSFLDRATSAQNVAKLDDGGWHALAGGLNDQVNALALKDGDLYAAGHFSGSGTTAGGDPVVAAQRIARWNGTAWSGVGGGLDNNARAVVVSPDGKIVVGGEFEHAGTIAASGVAAWDGAKWTAFGAGLTGGSPNRVGAIAFLGGKMYVGGQFTKAGSVDAKNVAVWDGTNWAALGDGLDGSVDALVVHDGKVVAGGYFKKSGTTDTRRIAAWDGSKWVELGGGMTPAPGGYTVLVQTLASRGDSLYVGGLLEVAGGTPVSHVARWNGTAWSSLGGGANDVVQGLFAAESSLWVAGTFSGVGGTSGVGSVGIARYWLGK